MSTRPRKFWGWGYEGEGPTAEQQGRIAALLGARFGIDPPTALPPPRIDEIALRAPRVAPPAALAALCSTAPLDRAGHTYGKSFRDVVRAFARDFANPPDVVALSARRGRRRRAARLVHERRASPRSRTAAARASSAASRPRRRRLPRRDLASTSAQLDRVLEIDRASRAARIQARRARAGARGPAAAARPHAAPLPAVVRVLVAGRLDRHALGRPLRDALHAHRRLRRIAARRHAERRGRVAPPARLGRRPEPRPPVHRLGRHSRRHHRGVDAAAGSPDVARRGVGRPSPISSPARAPCAPSPGGTLSRQLPPARRRTKRWSPAPAAAPKRCCCIAFESADHALDAWMARALALRARSRRHRARRTPVRRGTKATGAREGAAGAWRQSFLGAPYLRDALVGMGMISETFETAITWDRFEAFHAAVMGAAEDAVQRVCGARHGHRAASRTRTRTDRRRTTASSRRAGSAASSRSGRRSKRRRRDALIAHGGTITHHHAVGRDHRPWYDRQRPDGFAARARRRQARPRSGGRSSTPAC